MWVDLPGYDWQKNDWKCWISFASVPRGSLSSGTGNSGSAVLRAVTTVNIREDSRMIVVTGPLWLWSGGQASGHFVTIPEDQAGEFRAEALVRRGGFGSVKVEARINGVAWRTSVFPQKSGGYILPVKASVRRDASIAAGDEIRVELTIV